MFKNKHFLNLSQWFPVGKIFSGANTGTFLKIVTYANTPVQRFICLYTPCTSFNFLNSVTHPTLPFKSFEYDKNVLKWQEYIYKY